MSSLHARLEEEARKGDLVPFALDGTAAVLLSHPKYFRHVFVDAASRYSKTKRERPLFGNGLLTSEGEEWKAQRREGARLFLDQAEQCRNAVEKGVADLVAGWQAPGPRDIVPDVHQYTLRVLCDAFFGLEIGAEAAHLATKAIEILAGSRPRDRAALDVVARLADHVRQHGRLAPFFDNPYQVTTFLVAGSETSANTLAWTLHLLATAPQVAAAVRDGEDAIATAVVNEALRLYPPVWVITREVCDPDVIDGVPLAPGTIVYLFASRVHRDPRFWRDPDAFQPERFLAGTPPPFTFVPFGAGARTCIGRRVAMDEVVSAARAVTRAYDLRPSPDGRMPESIASTVLRPAGPVIIDFSPASR